MINIPHPQKASENIVSKLPEDFFSEVTTWDMLCFAVALVSALRHEFPFIEDDIKKLSSMLMYYYSVQIEEKKNEAN